MCHARPEFFFFVGLLLAPSLRGQADWQVIIAGDQRQARPPNDNKFRWLMGDLQIPEIIGKESSAGKIVGLQISVGDGGEVWLGDELQCRFDNDHPRWSS